jgi:hypothetical protein
LAGVLGRRADAAEICARGGHALDEERPADQVALVLELNSDILDSSKKVTIQCLNSSNDQESHAMWRALIEDLLTMMDHRALLLANRPISSNRARAAETILPAEVQDAWGAPPVVVWLAPVWATDTRLHPRDPYYTTCDNETRVGSDPAAGRPAAGRGRRRLTSEV